ncbi:MAG: hypothetical protein KIS92_16925 [Planctomycetota bacterium]|nr:hypothetical protein [Planctomycetota bacterium]
MRAAAKKPGAPAPRAKAPAPKAEQDEGPAYDSENAKTVMDEPVIRDEDVVSVEAEAEDDELALQSNEPAAQAEEDAQKPGKKFRPIRRPDDLIDRPTTIADTTPYLVIGGGVLALIILGSIVYMFMGPKPVTPKKQASTTTQETPAPQPAKPPPPAPPAVVSTPDPAKTAAQDPAKTAAQDPAKSSEPAPPAEAVKTPPPPVVNDANKACYFAAINFLMWAREDGLEWTPGQLTGRFRTEVNRKGVTDADVSDFAAKVEALLNTGLGHPMNPQERITYSEAGGHGGREVLIDDAVRKHYEIMDQIKLLTMKLRKKYGNPPPLPERKKEPPPEEKPATTSGPDEAPAPPKADPNQR